LSLNYHEDSVFIRSNSLYLRQRKKICDWILMVFSLHGREGRRGRKEVGKRDKGERKHIAKK